MALPKYVTFDCYGTLVDFAIDEVTRRTLGPRLDRVDAAAFLREFEAIRYQEILGEYRPYREVLRRSLAEAMRRFDLVYREDDGAAIVAAVPAFGPFPEAPPVLDRIRRHCKIVIISNTEDDLIAANVRNIGVPFDDVITAEQARAYKPSPAIFEHTLRRLGCAPDEILHVAQGFAYDIVPAHRLGWERVWINRRGQTGDPAYGPYRELPDLSGLPELIGIETRDGNAAGNEVQP
jgi:2-haloacid dehalogenase